MTGAFPNLAKLLTGGAAALALSACATTRDDMADVTDIATAPVANRAPAVQAFNFPPADAAEPRGQMNIPFSGPNVDPGNQTVIDTLVKDLNLRFYHTLTPDRARQQPLFSDGVKAVLQQRGMPVAPPEGLREERIQVPGAEGPLDAIVVRPATGTEARPIVVYFHGGGWVLASAEAYISSARALAAEARCGGRLGQLPSRTRRQVPGAAQ